MTVQILLGTACLSHNVRHPTAQILLGTSQLQHAPRNIAENLRSPHTISSPPPHSISPVTAPSSFRLLICHALFKSFRQQISYHACYGRPSTPYSSHFRDPNGHSAGHPLNIKPKPHYTVRRRQPIKGSHSEPPTLHTLTSRVS